MGESKPRTPAGVRARGDAIEVNFRWRGDRYYITWPATPNPQNLEAARRVRSQVAQRARLGILTEADLREFFPGAFPELEEIAADRLFGPLAQRWLDTVQVSQATRSEYKKLLTKYWIQPFSHRDIGSIRYSEVLEELNAVDWSSAKTRNNALIPLRGVFELARMDQLIDGNPTDLIKNMQYQPGDPDPFSPDEAEAILADLRTQADEIYALYFELAFFTGMRTGELLALRWKDVDLRSGVIRVKDAVSRGKLTGKTKTGKVRDVLLNDRAMAAVTRLREIGEHEHVFTSPRTSEPWLTDKAPRVVFQACLQRLGIRQRPAYNTRHTYATRMLMAGLNLAFIADQLGHSIAMLLKHYARWMRSDADRAEMEKLGAALGNGGKMVAKD